MTFLRTESKNDSYNSQTSHRISATAASKHFNVRKAKTTQCTLCVRESNWRNLCEKMKTLKRNFIFFGRFQSLHGKIDKTNENNYFCFSLVEIILL